jgi:hypothetical protein
MIGWMLYLVIKGFAQIDGVGATPAVHESGFPLTFLSGIHERHRAGDRLNHVGQRAGHLALRQTALPVAGRALVE